MFNKTFFEAMQRIHACLVNVQKEILRAYNLKYRERQVFQAICSNDDLVDMYETCTSVSSNAMNIALLLW